MTSAPVVALLTDFGARDHYVGTMKGVMLGICPDARFVDITHEVPAHDIGAAARQLDASYRYFPAGTIFLVVVDPGVGTRRRGLAAEAGAWWFVAPDNGVLSLVLDAHPDARLVELTSAAHRRDPVSRTFEGRDRFAPAAAWLARGEPMAALGPPLAHPVRLAFGGALVAGRRVRGAVVVEDRFGNLVTDLTRADLARVAGSGRVAVRLEGWPEAMRVVETYAEIAEGEVAAVVGSGDTLELAAGRASAAARTGAGPGRAVVATAVEPSR